MTTIRYYAKLLALPFFFLAIFISMFMIWEIADLPKSEEFAAIVEAWFIKYGMPAVFLSAILEGMLLVGGYFPGIFVIFLGIIFSDSLSQAVLVVAVATAGLFLSHIFNYALGKYGWYRLLVRFGMKGAMEKERERLLLKGPAAILGSYWVPSVGALTDTAAGIIRMPFRIFLAYSLASVLLTNIIVGILVYGFKDAALLFAAPSTTGSLVVSAIVLVWIAVLLIIDVLKKRGEKRGGK